MSASAIPRLPNNRWEPRPYQRGLWDYLENGGKRAAAVWHRRSGKDELCLHWAAVAAHQRVGTYWHMLPIATQARKAIWEAVNPHTGKRRIDEAFPKALRETTRENEMMIRFKGGSTWQVIGSDNFDALVGSPPIGVVFSEWALADPQAWSYIRPILAENGGWALFITTPRGKNHAKVMLDAAKSDPIWFGQVLTVDQTKAIPSDVLVQELTEYKRELGDSAGLALFEQEYYCSFDSAAVGAYYAEQMARAQKEDRIGKVPHDSAALVETWWDLGFGDATAIWFVQRIGKEIRVIDYIENTGKALDWYATEVKKRELQRGFVYSRHLLPHDAEAHELGTGKTRVETLKDLEIVVHVMPRQSVEDGINASRTLINQCWFDEALCSRGIEALRNYRKEWDEKKKTFKDTPLHDWASHGADAFRTGAMYKVPKKPNDKEILYPKLGIV